MASHESSATAGDKPAVAQEGVEDATRARADPGLTEKLARFKALRSQGVFFNDNLIRNKAFRNPHIYSKLVEFVDIAQSDSNFPRSRWDPSGLPSEALAESIRREQQNRSEERQAMQRHNRPSIAFDHARH